MTDLLVTEKTMTQLCRRCNTMVKAKWTLTHRAGMMIADKSVCDCGNVLWDWKYDPSAPVQQPPKPKGQVKLF